MSISESKKSAFLTMAKLEVEAKSLIACSKTSHNLLFASLEVSSLWGPNSVLLFHYFNMSRVTSEFINIKLCLNWFIFSFLSVLLVIKKKTLEEESVLIFLLIMAVLCFVGNVLEKQLGIIFFLWEWKMLLLFSSNT